MRIFATEYRAVLDYSYNRNKYNMLEWFYVIQYRKWWMIKWRVRPYCVKSEFEAKEIITKLESK